MKSVVATAVLAAACVASQAKATSSAPDAPAQAQSQATAASTAEAAPAARPDDEKLVCSTERRIGSRMPSRTCRTAAQAREQRERAQELLQDGQRAATPLGGGN